MPGGVGGQRREPLPTRLEITFPHETTKGAEHRNIIILSFSADPIYEISHFVRNDKIVVRERGRRDRALRARSRLTHHHRDSCHFD